MPRKPPDPVADALTSLEYTIRDDRVAVLTVEVSRLAEKIAEEKDDRRRGNRWRTAVVGLLVVCVLGLGWSVHAINNARHQAKIAACQRDNEQTERVNKAILSFARPSPERGVTLEQAQDYLRQHFIPLRDCSPAGIKAYYKVHH